MFMIHGSSFRATSESLLFNQPTRSTMFCKQSFNIFHKDSKNIAKMSIAKYSTLATVQNSSTNAQTCRREVDSAKCPNKFGA